MALDCQVIKYATMSTEESVISTDKPDFNGFTKISSFDCSYGFLVNSNENRSLSNQNDVSHNFDQNIIVTRDLTNSWCSDKSFHMACQAFHVMERPPVCVNTNTDEMSPIRKKLVYAPVSPVLQTFTPIKPKDISMEEKIVEQPVRKYDDIYNKFSRNRGYWDVQTALVKTDELLGKYCTNLTYYHDISLDKDEDRASTTIDAFIKLDQTPKSMTKTDSSTTESTPVRSEDSTGASKTIPVKISPPFLSMENSNNAMDNSIKIMEKLNLKTELCQDFTGPLSFENKIPKIKNKNKPKLFDKIKPVHYDLNNSGTINVSDKSLCTPTSPNLFSDDDSDDDNMDIDNSLDLPSQLKKENEKDDLYQRDMQLLRRLQKNLSGVLPPPSVTITQLNLEQMLDLYKTNLGYESLDQNSQLLTPRKRTLTDSILGSQNSCTPQSLKSWISLPASFSMTESIQTELQSQISKTDSASSPLLREKKSLLLSCTFEEMKEASWPEIMNCRYHGLHYNRNLLCEEFELLCMKFCERYVGAETQTSCTLGHRPTLKKNLKSRFTQSPGRRLSHLARRRQTFSSANLQAGCSLENKTMKPTASARQIMLSSKIDTNRRRYRPIQNRKTPSRKTPGKKTPNRKTPGKKTPSRKTPGKRTPCRKTPGKHTPSASAQKRRRIVLHNHDSSSSSIPTRETSKRALFQSPLKASETLNVDNISMSNSRLDGFPPRRALFHSPEKHDNSTLLENELIAKMTSLDSRKRKFSEISDCSSDSSPKSKFPRSLSFNSKPVGGKITLRRSSENIGAINKSSSSELSEVHRKKLLWAVAEALRSHNIGMSHPQFKTYAAVLARLTRKLLSEDKQTTGSTSEKMLKLAKLHVFSVIKGKTVDEIMIEEHIRKEKAAKSKVTGYVPLSEYEQNKISALNQRLIKHVVKNTTSMENHSTSNSITSMDCSSSPPKSILQDKSLNLENNILDPKIKARRQICFEDDPKR